MNDPKLKRGQIRAVALGICVVLIWPIAFIAHLGFHGWTAIPMAMLFFVLSLMFCVFAHSVITGR